MNSKRVVVFVHGTWSSPRIWCEFENYLRGNLGLDFEARCLQWSGGNSARARSDGTERFEGLIDGYADASIFVICHSHGANVVLSSADRVRERIRGVICLNSPIITTIEGNRSLVVLGLLLFLMFGSFVAALSVLGSVLRDGQNGLPSLGFCALFLAGALFGIARTRFAFLLFAVFAIAAAYPVVWRLREWLREAGIAAAWGSHIWYLWATVTLAAVLVVPALAIYAYRARRYARGINPRPVSSLVQVVAIDDEIFSLLGLALVLQRAFQFAMWPERKIFKPTLVLMWVAIILVWMKWLSVFDWMARVNGWVDAHFLYVALPLVGLAALVALGLFFKMILFGIAYGWDIGGLSVDHSIYVSPGSPVQETSVLTVQPEEGRDFWLSHPRIHQRESTFKLVADILRRALG